jgi:hypothetical protein
VDARDVVVVITGLVVGVVVADVTGVAGGAGWSGAGRTRM